MNQATARMRDLAERLIAYETAGNKSSGSTTRVAFPVCEALRPPLATLMGSAGFNALLARALARAMAEVPSLRAVQVNADGCLDVVEKPVLQADAQALSRDSVVLVAQLLGLLVDFIGENLTLRIVRDVWPKVALDDLYVFEERKK
jgi:hypothetical protein